MTKTSKILIVLFTLFTILMVGLATHRGNQWRERALKAETEIKRLELAHSMESLLIEFQAIVYEMNQRLSDPNLPEK